MFHTRLHVCENDYFRPTCPVSVFKRQPPCLSLFQTSPNNYGKSSPTFSCCSCFISNFTLAQTPLSLSTPEQLLRACVRNPSTHPTHPPPPPRHCYRNNWSMQKSTFSGHLLSLEICVKNSKRSTFHVSIGQSVIV